MWTVMCAGKLGGQRSDQFRGPARPVRAQEGGFQTHNYDRHALLPPPVPAVPSRLPPPSSPSRSCCKSGYVSALVKLATVGLGGF